MNFKFEFYLKTRGFSMKKYPNNVRVFELEKDKSHEEKIYFALTIHENDTFTSARSDKEGLYCQEKEMINSKPEAKKFVDEFISLDIAEN